MIYCIYIPLFSLLFILSYLLLYKKNYQFIKIIIKIIIIIIILIYLPWSSFVTSSYVGSLSLYFWLISKNIKIFEILVKTK